MNQRGSVPMALIIAVALLVVLGGGMAVCGDALFEDEDERDDLGIELVSRCRDCDDPYDDHEDDDDENGGDKDGCAAFVIFTCKGDFTIPPGGET